MKRTLRRILLGTGMMAATSLAALSDDLTVERFDPVPGDPILSLGTYEHPNGGQAIALSNGIGSAAFRGRWDAPDEFWTVSDRGPNISCEDAPAVLGLSRTDACPAAPGVPAGIGRLYPRPDYSPTIFKVKVTGDGTFRVLDTIRLRTASGGRVSGLLNPLTTATTEIPRDGAGNVLAQDVNAIDAEALVYAPLFGGRFFLAEENGPSIVEVAADGRILKRTVPAGTEADYVSPAGGLAPADYKVSGDLPALLARRRINRGLESLALSHDLRFLYAVMQSPLDNPDTGARDSRNIRILKLRLHPGPNGSTLTPVGEWVYPLEPASFFQAMGVTDARRQRDLRVSEMLALGGERFLVLERTDQATALFEIDLAGATNLLGSAWDYPGQVPTLEQTDLPAAGIMPVRKQLRLVASSLAGATPQFPEKLEGLAFAGDGRLMIINDDDFGVTGQRTQIGLVGGLPLVLRPAR